MSMMFEAHLPHSLWVEALFTANFLTNLVPTSVHDKVSTPFEKLNGNAHMYTALRVFGCACYPYLRPYALNKFDPKSLLCVFVGYTEKHKAYRCLHPPTGRVYISRHVLFDEETFPYTDVYKHLLPRAQTPLLATWYKGYDIPSENNVEETTEVEEPVLAGKRNVPPFQYAEADFPPLSPPVHNNQPVNENQQVFPAPVQHEENNVHQIVTRDKDGIRKPNLRYVLHTIKGVPPKPKTLDVSLQHPGWNGSMVEEIDTCDETRTWSFVPRPKDVYVLRCI